MSEVLVALFEKILVPRDGSEHSTKALGKAIEVAKKFDAKVTQIQVYSVYAQPILLPEPTTVGVSTVPLLTAAEVAKVAETARRAGNCILIDGEQRAKSEKVQVEKMFVEGHAVQEIVRVAKEEDFDLVVMGARGLSKIKEILLGSVSDGVIHHATCPILLVK